MSGQQSPPGWYPDPLDPHRFRWWDGTRWTDAFRYQPPGAPFDHSPPKISSSQGDRLAEGVSDATKTYLRALQNHVWLRWATGVVAIVLLVALASAGSDPQEVASRDDSTEEPRRGEMQSNNDESARLDSARRREIAERRVLRAVRAYYSDLNSGEFDSAWDRLSDSVQDDFGGYEHWKGGFATTEFQKPANLRLAEVSGDEASVTLLLRARDTDVCGEPVRQSFRGTWNLEKVGDRWVATRVSMRRVSGQPPTDDYSLCEQEPLPEDEVEPGTPADGCDPNYEGACIPADAYDLDCPEVGVQDFTVVGDDPHGFDRDGDGIACES